MRNHFARKENCAGSSSTWHMSFDHKKTSCHNEYVVCIPIVPDLKQICKKIFNRSSYHVEQVTHKKVHN